MTKKIANPFPALSRTMVDRYYEPSAKARITTITCLACGGLGEDNGAEDNGDILTGCSQCEGSGIIVVNVTPLISKKNMEGKKS